MRISDYIKETQTEMRHVSWLSRRQAVVYTAVVILISIVTSLYLGLFDYIFSLIIKSLVL